MSDPVDASVPIPASEAQPAAADLSLNASEDNAVAKSSYYHFKSTPKELQEQYKPKALTEPVQEAAVPKGASTWNKAGTWEESDTTEWAMNRLREIFVGIAPESGADVSVTEATDVSGEASTIFTRGKRVAQFDVSISLRWEGTHNGTAATGTIDLVEVDNSSIDDFAIKIKMDKDDEAHQALRAALRKCEDEFRERVAKFSKELVSHSLDE